MRLDANILKNRAIIQVSDDTIGVAFTHWTRKRHSWFIRWKDVTAIEVMSVEFPSFTLSFLFQVSYQKWVALSDDMEGWNLLEQAVRKRFPDFNWANIDAARRFENKNRRFLCWNRPAAEREQSG